MGQYLLPALLGLGMFLFGLHQFRKVQRSRSWPYTPGRIVAAKVETSVTRGNQDEADSTSYNPSVQYEYVVDSQYFRGDRIAFDNKGYSTAARAQHELRMYAVGASVWVFYDPAKPSSSVLERKASGGTVLMAIGAAVLLLLIAAMSR